MTELAVGSPFFPAAPAKSLEDSGGAASLGCFVDMGVNRGRRVGRCDSGGFQVAADSMAAVARPLEAVPDEGFRVATIVDQSKLDQARDDGTDELLDDLGGEFLCRCVLAQLLLEFCRAVSPATEHSHGPEAQRFMQILGGLDLHGGRGAAATL